MINEIKCKQASCSRVMLIESHKKCRRIICKFPNVTNMNHPEMGPVLHGCPYAHKKEEKKRKDQSETDRITYDCRHFDDDACFCFRRRIGLLLLALRKI